MSKRIFNEEQIKELLQNENVATCSSRSITYQKNFKVLAVRTYLDEGLSPNRIFRNAGFNIDMIGRDIPGYCLHRWLKTFRIKGVEKLFAETRGKAGGRPKTNWADEKEKIKYLEAENAYLKAENSFLAKLRKKSLN